MWISRVVPQPPLRNEFALADAVAVRTGRYSSTTKFYISLIVPSSYKSECIYRHFGRFHLARPPPPPPPLSYLNPCSVSTTLLTVPDYGYYPNANKTWLIVKDSIHEEAKSMFKSTGVSITVEGKRHLGAAIGTNSFVKSYVERKISGWILELDRLSSIALTQPHAAYAAFIHGLKSKWTYLSRTIPGIGDMLEPLENTIRQPFPTFPHWPKCFQQCHEGLDGFARASRGLGIVDPCSQSSMNISASEKITAPL